MNFLPAVHRLLLAIAMLAIVIGPMSIGLASSAMASSDPAMTDGMSATMAGMQMAEQMPCCPEQQSVKPDCAKGCPLALVCTTSIFANAPDVHGWSFAISWLSHRYDLVLASQLTPAYVEPPARPPKA
ncbi:hypothetical protein HFO74_19525 [Rhizobium laguerreae]|uniref:DUF2946 domain-containing protein n=1 Tax=Rhizobium laguerreae TaxID=1076926 RepID=A0AAJ3A4I7_9HYPH|nr:hypothetical protein [Rhizobium laguerreae]MBY3065583.1 hypothetical protein [Rhizobium laguerreae]MBY3076551.1 hypothetical protein [Rhizobium laguerreae]MBY3111582.1 hypothetical protein [Rhizobium laguerreae]MBY3142889.1 hypothetical protein [Rhizobium laguerreae]MBY3241521.1 hypothetical protein [Rhizobium laguerreae]